MIYAFPVLLTLYVWHVLLVLLKSHCLREDNAIAGIALREAWVKENVKDRGFFPGDM